MEVLARCLTQYAQHAELQHKYHSSLQKADRYIAESITSETTCNTCVSRKIPLVNRGIFCMLKLVVARQECSFDK